MLQETHTHKSVERALQILTAFTPDNQKKGTTELSEELGLHKSTVSRILGVMEYYGLVQQDVYTKKYNLGRMAVELGVAVIRSLNNNLVMIAQPHIDELRNKVHETVSLEVVSGNGTILAYRAMGRQAVNVSTRVGQRMPTHVAAGAKAIMAFSPPKIVNNFLKGKFTRFTPNTVTDRKMLKRKLKEYKQQGFATDSGEMDSDVHVIAVPIFNYEKRPVAAIVIAVPTYRVEAVFKPDTISLLKDTAAKISSDLYYPEEELS
jgi:DNA-binding IclR family transcriptional regulator